MVFNYSPAFFHFVFDIRDALKSENSSTSIRNSRWKFFEFFWEKWSVKKLNENCFDVKIIIVSHGIKTIFFSYSENLNKNCFYARIIIL